MLSLVSSAILCQNISNLDNNHRFKNITIGMPINILNGKLQFIENKGDFTIYKSTDINLYSIFDVKMDLVCIISKENKVYAIEVSKRYKASEQPNKAITFSTTELDALESGLTNQYGKPTHYLKDSNSKYTRIGSQWQSHSYTANCFIDFYGTFEGYMIYFSLSQLSVDF
jgi:hypothetical protein